MTQRCVFREVKPNYRTAPSSRFFRIFPPTRQKQPQNQEGREGVREVKKPRAVKRVGRRSTQIRWGHRPLEPALIPPAKQVKQQLDLRGRRIVWRSYFTSKLLPNAGLPIISRTWMVYCIVPRFRSRMRSSLLKRL